MGAFTIAGRSFRSRLMLGTGKYRSPEIMAACHRESGAEIIAVAVRRVNLAESEKDSVAMASAMRHAVIAGRLAYEAGRMGQFLYANASSPRDGLSEPVCHGSESPEPSARKLDRVDPELVKQRA